LEVDGRIGDFQGWRRDLIYADKINHGGVLRALKPSREGGLTGFLDQADAYDRLSGELKHRVQGLHVVYQMTTYDQNLYSTQSRVRMVRRSEALKSLLERRDTDFPPVLHPLVFTHPESGRTILNFSPGHAIRVHELSSSEGHELLQALADHLFQCPSYPHRWTTDEMVLWDNWRMLHMVSLVPSGEERIMQRTTISGDYGLGRKLQEL
jgi:taurine dioxygenase